MNKATAPPVNRNQPVALTRAREFSEVSVSGGLIGDCYRAATVEAILRSSALRKQEPLRHFATGISFVVVRAAHDVATLTGVAVNNANGLALQKLIGRS